IQSRSEKMTPKLRVAPSAATRIAWNRSEARDLGHAKDVALAGDAEGAEAREGGLERLHGGGEGGGGPAGLAVLGAAAAHAVDQRLDGVLALRVEEQLDLVGVGDAGGLLGQLERD